MSPVSWAQKNIWLKEPMLFQNISSDAARDENSSQNETNALHQNAAYLKS